MKPATGSLNDTDMSNLDPYTNLLTLFGAAAVTVAAGPALGYAEAAAEPWTIDPRTDGVSKGSGFSIGSTTVAISAFHDLTDLFVEIVLMRVSVADFLNRTVAHAAYVVWEGILPLKGNVIAGDLQRDSRDSSKDANKWKKHEDGIHIGGDSKELRCYGKLRLRRMLRRGCSEGSGNPKMVDAEIGTDIALLL